MCDLENLKNEEAMTRVGSQCHRKKRRNYSFYNGMGEDIQQTDDVLPGIT